LTGRTPNIIYILTDDLGYGDLSCYGATKLHTPNADRLAERGMRFTDCHSSSAVCTPTRYSILTGRYCWRTELKRGVLKGFSPLLIERERLTVAEMLKQSGYATACIGKWHLGLGWQHKEDGSVDFSLPLLSSPLDNGFDYYFGISASLNMEPYCFIRDCHTVGIPSVPKHPVHRGQNPNGLMVDDWKDELVNTRITEEALAYIRSQVTGEPAQPFFLYLPLTGPHNPWVPNEEFRGKSQVGLRGDMILEMDWSLGKIMSLLEELEIDKDTLLIFTSDNGPHSFDVDELAVYGHDQTAGYRGQKADIWEGGHRVPFIASWPNAIPEGTVSSEPVELTDFMATCAEIVGAALPDGVAEDSCSILSVMLGRSLENPIREAIVSHSLEGMFAVRKGKWKLIDGPLGGGFHWKEALRQQPDAALGQLYDMESDAGEQDNLYDRRPEVVAELRRLLDGYRGT
jgi:arylsulfatase A-like enzyme